MSTHTMEHQRDWEAQCERLSAYLDDELAGPERTALQAHVAGCARCAAELAELRQVRGLMRALPATKPPRSFALPESASGQARPAGRAQRPRWAAPVQWAGGLAAAAGLLLVVGGTLAGGGVFTPTSARTFSGAAAQPQQTSHATNDQLARPTTPPGTASGGGSAPSAQTTTPAGGQGTPAPPTREPASSGTSTGTSIAPELPGLPIAGATLLVGGAAAFAVGRRAGRRRV